MRKGSAFGEKFSEQSIEIFVGTSLFGTVKVSEKDLAFYETFDGPMVSEFEPVIKRDCVDRKTPERNLDMVRD